MLDPSLLPADAVLIETLLRSADGQVPLWPWHRARLWAAARRCGYRFPLLLIEQALAGLALPSQGPQRVRLLLQANGQFELTVVTLPGLLPIERRVALASHPLQADPRLLQIKSTYRPWYAEATQWLAQQTTVFDVIYVNTQGELCEGIRSNLYLCFDKSPNAPWFTPPRSAGLLPGVARAQLLACQPEPVHERTCTLDDLRRAQRLRVSNALRGWFDVELCVERAPC